MYLRKNQAVDLTELVSNRFNIYAHRDVKKDNTRYETLFEHSYLVTDYFFKIINEKQLEEVLERFEKAYFNGLSDTGKELFKRMVVNVFSFHDIGKINPVFQKEKMDNAITENLNFYYENLGKIGSHHSIISSVIYIDYFWEEIKGLDKRERNLMLTILLVNGYIISRHHSNLDSFIDYLNSFEDGEGYHKILKFIDENYSNIYTHKLTLDDELFEKIRKSVKKQLSNASEEKEIFLYGYARFMYSLLIASDYYATTQFKSGIKITDFGNLNEIEELYKDYSETPLIKSIRQYEKSCYDSGNKDFTVVNDINVMRNEMFLDAEKMYLNEKSKNIFFLEAPTGSGKSNTALNLSFQMMKNNRSLMKFIEVAPFNTLVEQNMNSLIKIFGREISDKAAIINSIYPIKQDRTKMGKDSEDDYQYYAEALLNRQFLNYPLIITTHVSIFNVLFGNGKGDAFSFFQLANSVIILDEIQSYKNLIWGEIINFLSSFAELMNIKIIIMSATLPDLKMLITDDNLKCRENIINLIKDREKYFSHPLFKDRVSINYELFDSTDILKDLMKKVLIQGKKKVLVEFISKASAYLFFEELRSIVPAGGPVLELLTGDDNVIERERIVGRLAEDKDVEERGIILVSTQVIEAGIDIDMDIGFKDISKLDSEEQFMGRINRSCLRKGMVYFFDYNQENRIYKNDLRISRELSLRKELMKGILSNKDFGEYYGIIVSKIKNEFNEAENEDNIHEFFRHKAGMLDYGSVAERMKLIDDDQWSMTVFLNRTIEISRNKEGTDLKESLIGSKVWEEYKQLLHDNKMDYSKKQVLLSRARSKMNYFIYTIKKNIDLAYNDKIGEIYYIEGGEDYFKGGKLDRNKFENEVGIFMDI